MLKNICIALCFSTLFIQAAHTANCSQSLGKYIPTKTIQKLDELSQTNWWRRMPLPLNSLSKNHRSQLKESLPIESVGALLMKKRPFRGTAVYLGKSQTSEGETVHIFSTSAHLGGPHREVFSVEMGHSTNQKVKIDLDPNPIFLNTPGDIAIFKATSLDQSQAKYLSNLRPIKMLGKNLEEVLLDHPETKFFSVGRIVSNAIINLMKSDNQTFSMFTPEQRTQLEKAIREEARDNLSEHSDKFLGDFLAVTPTEVLARGKSQEMLDPDGLYLDKEGTPFEASDTVWKVESIATRSLVFGGMSGSPVIALIDGQPYMVGINWTMPGYTNVSSLARVKDQNKESDVFPDVKEVIRPDGSKFLKLESEGLAGGFAATTSRVATEIIKTLKNEEAGENQELLTEVLNKFEFFDESLKYNQK